MVGIGTIEAIGEAAATPEIQTKLQALMRQEDWRVCIAACCAASRIGMAGLIGEMWLRNFWNIVPALSLVRVFKRNGLAYTVAFSRASHLSN